MKQKLISILFSFIFLFIFLYPVKGEVKKDSYDSLLRINNIYKLIMSSYYKPLPGPSLLNEAIKVLALEAGEKLDNLKINLNNEQALEEFNKIFFTFADKYKGNISDLSLKIGDAMIKSLNDKYSSLIKYEDYIKIQDLLTDTDLTGLGFIMAEKGGNIYISSVFPDTPASVAGIKTGDILIEVNNVKIGSSLNEIYDLFPSKAGEIAVLKILRNKEILEFPVKIEKFSVKAYSIEEREDIIYLKIFVFSKDLKEKIISDLNNFNLNKVNGIIIDLRNSPGGDFDSAIDFFRIFVDEKGSIVINDNKGQKNIYGSNSSTDNIPAVVLVNEFTMSSAEIVTAAMKTSKRAVIIGERTYGKGLSQGLFPLDNDFVLRLTVCEFFTSFGEKINNNGIEPDIIIQEDNEQMIKAIEILKGANKFQNY